MWNNIVQYNIDKETFQKAYINLALLAIQVRGGWNFIVKKIRKIKKGKLELSSNTCNTDIGLGHLWHEERKGRID